jgi:hypothetical protein
VKTAPIRTTGLLVCAILATLIAGCASSDPSSKPVEKIDGEEVFDPGDPRLEPEIKQGKFRVYVLYRPQVQYRDFNGVFDIGAGGARIVRDFWKRKFNELTRPGHYGEFFIEFYEYMSSFAQSYPTETREKELLLAGIEKSFQAFCAVLGIEDMFDAFQKDQERIYDE